LGKTVFKPNFGLVTFPNSWGSPQTEFPPRPLANKGVIKEKKGESPKEIFKRKGPI